MKKIHPFVLLLSASLPGGDGPSMWLNVATLLINLILSKGQYGNIVDIYVK